MLSSTAGEDTFGIRIASGRASMAAFRSASPQGVWGALTRMMISRSAVAAALHGGADLLAGDLLGIRRHRVLQIEDQRVGGQGLRLVERPLVGTGHIEHAATQAEIGHGEFPWFALKLSAMRRVEHPDRMEMPWHSSESVALHGVCEGPRSPGNLWRIEAGAA